jgi:hypothetical protein
VPDPTGKALADEEHIPGVQGVGYHVPGIDAWVEFILHRATAGISTAKVFR